MAIKKILLVDDDEAFLELAGSRIESWGYEVVTAKSGRIALEIVKNDRPDIVVLDYVMPEWDGIATLKRIRKVDKDIPVIILTAYQDDKSIEAAERLGIEAYVPKMSAYIDSHEALRAALNMAANKV